VRIICLRTKLPHRALEANKWTLSTYVQPIELSVIIEKIEIGQIDAAAEPANNNLGHGLGHMRFDSCNDQSELLRQVCVYLLGIRRRSNDPLRSRSAAIGACERQQEYEARFLVKSDLDPYKQVSYLPGAGL
jgi:hypothetical protein